MNIHTVKNTSVVPDTASHARGNTQRRGDKQNNRVLRDNDHRLGWQDRERAQSVRLGYEKMGWQFGLPERGPGVMMMTPSGNWYRVTDDTCTCPAGSFGHLCKHRLMLTELASIESLIEALEYYDDHNAPTLTHNMG